MGAWSEFETEDEARRGAEVADRAQPQAVQHATFVTLPQPQCIGCGKFPNQLDEYVSMGYEEVEPGVGAPIDGFDVDAYVRMEEGTYNAHNGHFLCTECYVKAGMPSAPGGWVAP